MTSLRDALTPFANTGFEAYGFVDRLFTGIVTALRRDQRFAALPLSQIELLLADERADTEQQLFNELRDRVHLDDVDYVAGAENV